MISKGTVSSEVQQHDGYQTCDVENKGWEYKECLVNPNAENMTKGDVVYVSNQRRDDTIRNRVVVADHVERLRDVDDDLLSKYLGLPVKTSRFKAFMKWVW